MEILYRAGLSNAVSATVLAVVVICLGPILTKRPAVRHCLWVLVLLKLVTPAFYEVSIPWAKPSSVADELAAARELVLLQPELEQAGQPYPDEAGGEERVCAGDLCEPAGFPGGGLRLAESYPCDWMRLACLLWIAGMATTLMVALSRIRRFQRLLHEASPADQETQECALELAARLGLDQSPSVWFVPGKVSPMIWPLSWRPRLILPVELWAGLDDQQRATLILHELAHLRRGDHYLRFFELAVTALYWWHPVLWWARRALRDAEEECCDAWVMWAAPDAAKSYAHILLDTLDFLNRSDRPEPLLASGFGTVGHLRKRLTMIMSGSTPRLLGVWGTLGVLGLAIALLPVNASWAQRPEEERDARIVITTDDDRPVSSSSTATDVDAASGEAVDVISALKVDGSDRVEVVLKSGDKPPVVASGALDEVIKKLKEQIKEVAKKSPQSERDKARQKAIERTVKQLEVIAQKLEKARALGDLRRNKGLEIETLEKDKAEASKAVLRAEVDHERAAVLVAAANKKQAEAEIQKAQDQIAKLTKDLHAKQRELTEARRKLAELTGARKRAYTVVARPVRPEVEKRQIRVRELPSATIKPEGPASSNEERIKELIRLKQSAIGRRDSADANEKRIAGLEKKLEKLLDEVAKLKKDREK